jgi:hypothetical protein
MRIDLFTRVILTIIALLLAVIALRPILQPQAVMAQGSFSGVQFSSDGALLTAVDTRTGEIWVYDLREARGTVYTHLKIAQLGKPLAH